MAEPGAAVMTHEVEPRIPELLHDLDHVLGHDTKAVIDVVGTGLRQRAVAIAAQVGEDDVIVLRQACGDAIPRHVVDRMAVKHQQRRARTAMAQADDGAFGAHVEVLEPGEQGGDLGVAPAGRIAHIVGGIGFGDNCRLLRQ